MARRSKGRVEPRRAAPGVYHGEDAREDAARDGDFRHLERDVATMRLAAEGMQFPWRWNGGTISLNLGVVWEMSVRRYGRAPREAALGESVHGGNWQTTVR